MNATLRLVLATLLASGSVFAQTFPIRNGKLQSDMNANKFSITNLVSLLDTNGNPIVGGSITITTNGVWELNDVGDWQLVAGGSGGGGTSTNYYFYSGYSTNATLTDNQVTNLLTGVATNTYVRAAQNYTPVMEYIYWSHPMSWGTAAFWTPLGQDTGLILTTNTAHGLQYRTYRTQYILEGSYSVSVQ